MRTFSAVAAIAVALGIGSCGDEDHRDYFNSATSEVRSDVSIHDTYIHDTANMRAADQEIDRHAAEIRADMAHLRAELTDLDEACNAPGMGSLTGKVQAIQDRIDAYLADASAMTDLGEVRAECDRYQSDVDALLDDLLAALDQAWCR